MKSVSDKAIRKAIKGKRKQKKIIFDTYKVDLFYLCELLIDDEKSVNAVMGKVFESIWKKAEAKSIQDADDFKSLLYSVTCKTCRQHIFGKDVNIFKVNKTTAVDILGSERTEFTGNVDSGFICLNKALNKLNSKQRFVFVSVEACDFSFKEIGTIIKQRDAVARYYYNCASIELSRELPENVLTIDKVASLLEKNRPNTIPEETELYCLNIIKKKQGKKHEKK